MSTLFIFYVITMGTRADTIEHFVEEIRTSLRYKTHGVNTKSLSEEILNEILLSKISDANILFIEIYRNVLYKYCIQLKRIRCIEPLKYNCKRKKPSTRTILRVLSTYTYLINIIQDIATNYRATINSM